MGVACKQHKAVVRDVNDGDELHSYFCFAINVRLVHAITQDEFISNNFSCTVLHVKVNCQCTAQAAVIGTNSDRAYTAERGRRFYLNTADPAPCSGTINGWRYCFYNPGNIRDNRIYNATFGVYRAVSIGNSVHYQRVSDALTTVSWHGDQITTSPNFKCYDISVNSFTIEAGNLVAACVYDPGEPRRSTRQLDIIGRNAVGYSLMQMNDVSGCSDISLPSDILSSQLSNINNRILHAYATIIGKFRIITFLLTHQIVCFLI